ncbi:hypothetical protein HOD38_04085 [archaeon]|jgi:hypothetical protein|nr:hypothetical protein [archaeon]MBT4397420.1 hypothetical protein [archaeon]MBT4440492.1 hypothetical protein [archaeon]
MKKSLFIIGIVLFILLIVYSGSAEVGTVCINESDCGDGEVCTEGLCALDVECVEDAECGTGFVCETSVCVEDVVVETQNETEEVSGTGAAETETVVQLITLELEGDRFVENSALEGIVTLGLDQKVSVDETFKVTVGGNEYTLAFSDILSSSNYSFSEQAGPMNTSNSELSKMLTFTEAGEQYVAVELDRYSQIDNVEVGVSGVQYSATYPQNVTIDFGGEGNMDWYYFGDFVSYNSDVFVSPDFDGVSEGVAYITNNDTYYCELIDIPETKEVNITVGYTKMGSDGDIKAVILSVPGGNPLVGFSGGNDNCDLSESKTEDSCSISMEYPIEGEYLFCVYSDISEDDITQLFELPTDTTGETTTSFTCPVAEGSLCTPVGNNNFDIKVNTGSYDKQMKETIVFGDWETFYGSVSEGFEFYVGSGDYSGVCETDTCIIPVLVSSDTKGSVNLTNIKIDFTPYNQDLQSSLFAFYDLEVSPNLVAEVSSRLIIYGTNVDVDLSLFNISLPIGTYDFQVDFLGESETTPIEVVSEADYYTPSELISEVKSKYATYLTSSSEEGIIVSILGLDRKVQDAKDKIEGYEPQVGFVSNIELLGNIETALNELPWEIEFTEDYKDTQIVEPNDISADIGGDEVYFQQEAVKVVGESKKVTITNYDGTVSTYRLIKKTVQANEDMDSLNVFIVSTLSTSSLATDLTPTTVSTNIGKYVLSDVSSGSSEVYYYLGAESESLDDYTIVITYENEEEEPECVTDEDCNSGYECYVGDCIEKESSALIWIVLVVLVLLVGGGVGAYFYLKRSKPLNKKVLQKEEPDSEIMKFIKNGMKKGMGEGVIKQVLIKKGWKKAEIEKEFKKFKSGGKELSEIGSFVADAKKKGIGDEAIRQVLIKKGWNKKEIEDELRRRAK